MRKYLLPSALILLLGLGLAFAQTITKAIQLSQDATGAFGVDTNNNVYFPAHILTTGPGTPVIAFAGTTGSTIAGTDTSGTVTGAGVGTASGTVTFNKAYAATPYCIVISENPGTSPVAYSASTTAITISSQIGSSVVHYLCSGSK